MQKFTTLKAIAAPLNIQNVDTDMIIPKQFLTTIKRTGLGEGLFFEMRYDVNGKKIEDFVLHQQPWDKAQILVSGDNFGCGSSREHAPWALNDFGIRSIIAPSFADIFYNNCFKNGMLPIKLPQEQVDQIMQVAQRGEQIDINLPQQTIRFGNTEIKFDVDATNKHNLLNGLDDIGLTLENAAKIEQFEGKQNKQLVGYINMAQILVPHPEFADTFFTDQHIIACNGTNQPNDIGHPKVYLEMEENKQITCPYCSRKFIFKH